MVNRNIQKNEQPNEAEGHIRGEFERLREADDLDVLEIDVSAFFAMPLLAGSDGWLTRKDRTAMVEIGKKRALNRQRTREVAVAVVGDEIFIVSGAKRRAAWLEGILQTPESVVVSVHHAKTLKQAQSLVEGYKEAEPEDSSASVIKAAYKQHGLELKTARLKEGTIAQALYFCFRGSLFWAEDHPSEVPINLTDAVGLLKDELRFLEDLKCPRNVFYTGILGMALQALAISPDAKEFIRRVAKKEGDKERGAMNPVEGVLFLASLADRKKIADLRAFQPELYRRSLRGLSLWISRNDEKTKYWYKGVFQELDPADFVAEFRSKKNILDRIDL